MMECIKLQNVSIDFPVYVGGMNSSFKQKLIEIGTAGKIRRSNERIVIVSALKNIDLTINQGERVGFIGRNGAGKTTLLKTISGFCEPVEGQVSVTGKCTPLFNISAGLDVERTGYENIRFMGTLLGLRPYEIDELIPDIEEFTELGDYLNLPVRTYSAGMQVRLGFAVITGVQTDILLLDEAIGVGDAHFVQKANQRAQGYYNKSGTLVVTSHSNDIIRELCERVIVLKDGRIVMDADTETAIKFYEEMGKPQIQTKEAFS